MFKFAYFKRHIKEISTFLILIFVCICMLSYNGLKYDNFRPKKAGLDFIAACQKGVYNISKLFSNTANSISEFKNIKKEYYELLSKQENYQFLTKNYQELLKENRRLRIQLGYMQQGDIPKIPAIITGGKTNNFYKGIVINQGSEAGIRKNMPVIAYSKGFPCLVGKVMESAGYSSLIKPITDHTMYIPARLQELRYHGLVNGKEQSMDNTLEMKHISKLIKNNIKAGDVVITTALNEFLPENIYIGTVKNIISREYESSLTLELEPFIDFQSLEYVFVLKTQGWEDEK